MCPNSIWHIWLTWWQSEESVTVPGFRMGSGDRDTCKLTTASSQFAKWIIIICCTFWELYVKKSVHCENTYCVKTCRDGGFICPTCSKVSATRESLSKPVAKLLWKNVRTTLKTRIFCQVLDHFWIDDLPVQNKVNPLQILNGWVIAWEYRLL